MGGVPEGHELVDPTTLKPVTLNDEAARRWLVAQRLHPNSTTFTDYSCPKAANLSAHPAGSTGPSGPTCTGLASSRVDDHRRPHGLSGQARSDTARRRTLIRRRNGRFEFVIRVPRNGSSITRCLHPMSRFESIPSPSRLNLTRAVRNTRHRADGSGRPGVFFIAEGLATRFHPAIRVPDDGRLSTCTATVESPAQPVLPAGPIDFGDRDLSITITVGGAEIEQQLLLTPLTWRCEAVKSEHPPRGE